MSDRSAPPAPSHGSDATPRLPAAKRRDPRRSYGSVAWCYDELAALYSLGRIERAKRSQLARLRPGSRILYAGAGRGSDALAAARQGVDTVCLDLSAVMLKRLQRRFSRAGRRVETVCGDLFEYRPARLYDGVVANFVLNVFAPDRMRAALAHLAGLVRPGGEVLIADFAPPSGSGWQRALCHAYYGPVSLAAWICGLAALHPLYDTARELPSAGLELVQRECFRVIPGGPVLYESITARRPHRSSNSS